MRFTGRARARRSKTAAFGDLKARCYGIGSVMLCLAALVPAARSGRPELAFLLPTRPTLSILSFGSFTLLASILVSGFLVANLMYVPFVRAGARRPKRRAWRCRCHDGVHRRVLGWIEAVCAVEQRGHACAVRVVVAVGGRLDGVRDRAVRARCTRLSGWMLLLHRVHLAVLVLELVMLAGFVAFRVLQPPSARESLAIPFDPSGLGPWFVVGLVGLGLLVPLAVEVFVTVTKRLVRAPPVDLLCIAGGLVLRFCVVWSGMH